MLTITGGILKGRHFRVPRDWPIRPTTSLVREAIFHRLGSDIRGARLLDLFGGSGLMTFEAFSRGAEHLVTVEAERKHCAHIIRQANEWHIPTRVVCRRVENFLQKPPQTPYDLVFMDPPYAYDQWSLILPVLMAWTHDNSTLIIEHDDRLVHPSGETRLYGNTAVTWLTRSDLRTGFVLRTQAG